MIFFWVSYLRFRFSLFRKRLIYFVSQELILIRNQIALRGISRKTDQRVSDESFETQRGSFEILFARADNLLMLGQYSDAQEIGDSAERLRTAHKVNHFANTFMNDWAGGDWVSNIGHTALGLQLLRMRTIVEGNSTPVVFHSYGSTNKLLVQKMAQYLQVKKMNLLDYYKFEEMFRVFRLEMNFINTTIGVLEINEAFKYYSKLTITNLEPLSLNEDEERSALNCLLGSALDLSRPLITVHVRESAKEDALRSGNYSDLETVIQACLPFAEQGFQFVRMGHPGMKRLSSLLFLERSPYKNSFFDYANSPIKSDLMDLFFWSRCGFFIGGDSGPITVPMLFNKPVLRLNANKPFLENIGYSGYVVPKLLRNQMTGDLVSYMRALNNTSLWSHRLNTAPLKRECVPTSVITASISDMIEEFITQKTTSVLRTLNDTPPSICLRERAYQIHELSISPSFYAKYLELFD